MFPDVMYSGRGYEYSNNLDNLVYSKGDDNMVYIWSLCGIVKCNNSSTVSSPIGGLQIPYDVKIKKKESENMSPSKGKGLLESLGGELPEYNRIVLTTIHEIMEYLYDNDMTREDFADKIDMKVKRLENILEGLANLRVKDLTKIAKGIDKKLQITFEDN